MNGSKSWALITAPVTMVAALVVAIPLLFTPEECGAATAYGTPVAGITVGTWNVWGDAGGRTGKPFVVRAPYIAERITAIHPDIFMLQESSARKEGAEFQQYLIAKTGYQAAGPGNDHRKILYDASRLQLLDSGAWDLPGPGFRTGVYGKFLDRRTQKPLVAVSTHLEYRTGKHYQAVRLEQMRTLESKMTSYAGGIPVVLGGDLNTSEKRDGVKGNGAVNHLQARQWVNSNTAATKANSSMGTALGVNGVKTRRVTSPGPTAPIDYIFSSPGATVHWWALQPQAPIVDKHYIRINSDHNIITAGITLAGFGDPSPTNTSTPPPTGAAPTEAAPTDAAPTDAAPTDAAPTEAAPTEATSNSVAPASFPVSVGVWKGEQLKNAAAIIAAGRSAGVSQRGQAIAIMTAMGESSLKVLNRGDAAGPDSRGLFQQRTSWGTLAERLDPQQSSMLFYKALVRVTGWADLEPTIAAHRVQRNADPHHYEQFWDDAQKVYQELSGLSSFDATAALAPECATATTDPGGWTPGGECTDTQGTPRGCVAALREAARIAREAPCRNEVRGGNWDNRCGEFVARVYGYASSGEATAMSHYRSLKARSMIHTDKSPPPGALVFFTTSNPAGHVAVYNGNGKAWSNDFVREGCINLTDMDQMGGGGRYLGWSVPSFPRGARL